MVTKKNKKRILLLGGGGYLGSVLTGQLLDAGYCVDVFDALLFGAMGLDNYQGNKDFRLIEGDIRDIGSVTEYIPGAYGVILLAAMVGEPACDVDPKATVDINLVATKAAAEAARYYEVPRFVFASTDSIYGIREGVMAEDSPKNPISLYARLKLRAEEEILGMQGESFQPTILRMATIYGLSPRMRFDLIINILTLHAVTKGEITIMGGKQWRPLVHVADAARAYVMSLQTSLDKVGGQCFNVGSNDQNYQIGTLGEQVKEVCSEIEVKIVPQTPDLRDYYVNCDKIAETMGYTVGRTVKDAVKEIRAALQNGDIADPLAAHHYNVAR